ncbi:hypothetical protein Salat_2056800 [Sesamum alatum]|uniref:Uncharacterized protein n=1 Tax=Sesamum alatum TaxID=300844 RepID=A0AAE1Y113_9LAMI|nr:hypothetical protein Salat_2056800 [Sesamum alatum]
MEAKANSNRLATAIIVPSCQTIHPAGATTTAKPPLKIHPPDTSARTPFSAIAPPEYLQVSRLRLRVTLDTIREESKTDDYDCIETESTSFSDVIVSSEECFSGEMLAAEETSDLVLEMAVSSYRTCFRESRGKTMPPFTPYNFRCM